MPQPHMASLKTQSPLQQRKIIHIDMDAFFASIEQLDNPRLRGKPVIVGGDPSGRGVVAACSYEARTFGIHSAMPCAHAQRLCRQAVFVRPRRERYLEISRQTMALFSRYTDLVEPLSIDEAFLDITVNHLGNPSATRIAQLLRREIYAVTGLTASAGVSYNKFLAKVASDQNKPDGLSVILPQEAEAFIRRLPVRKFYGVGQVTEKKMHRLGIRTGADLARFSREELSAAFGSNGAFFYEIVRGIDHRPVHIQRTRKSIGSETTLQEDVLELEAVLEVIEEISRQVGGALERRKIGGRTLSLKVRYDDFTTISRSQSSPGGFFDSQDIRPQIPGLLAATEAGQRKIRLLGLTVSNLMDQGRYRQLPLPFPAPTLDSPGARIAQLRRREPGCTPGPATPYV
ncbi:DNA polymerase IV [Desulfogranum mediterraneum]|uniref:DNA polymerase IV n=1 Tax=Desulfogranum mediterraneum TaxID=160661 RepID=UPI000400B4E5|nr:DNA polymerase IV [Desulfogranum mediterraneum]